MTENYTRTNTKEYKIEIDNLIYQKIMHWIDRAPGEVSGLGKLVINKETGLIEIKSAILLKQENTGTSTDIDGAALGKAMFETKDDEGTLNWWWHSHVNMDVFWSGTDMETIRTIGNQGFLVSTVFNKKHEMLSSFYVPVKDNQFFTETFIDGIETTITYTKTPEQTAIWNAEFDSKCSTKTWDYNHEDYKWNTELQDWELTDKYQSTNREMGVDDSYWLGEDELNTDDNKIWSQLPVIIDLGKQLKEEKEFENARVILQKICSTVDKLKLSSKTRSYQIKKPYFTMFNSEFPGTLTRG